MIALVTGGTGGLGAAICRTLADRGHDVAIGFHERREEAALAARGIAERGRRAMALALDVTQPETLHEASARIAREWGGLDILVNAAAHNADGLLAALTPDEVARVYGVNVGGTMNAVRAALPWLIGGGRGRVVNFSSVLAARAMPGISAYAGTKGAIEALTRSLAVELGPKNVTVNAVAPGFIDAGLGRKPVNAAGDALRSLVPLRRAGGADEVAEVVAFLVSDAARYVTGAVIPVDGGLLAGSKFAAWRPQESTPEEAGRA